MAGYLENLDELFQDVRAWPDSQLTWALEWAALTPFGDATFAEELPAIVALHWVYWDLQTDSANQRIFELLVHLAVEDPLDVITSMVMGLALVS